MKNRILNYTEILFYFLFKDAKDLLENFSTKVKKKEESGAIETE